MNLKLIIIVAIVVLIISVTILGGVYVYKCWSKPKPESNELEITSDPTSETFDTITNSSMTGGHKENKPFDFFAFQNRAKPNITDTDTSMNKVNDTVNEYSNVTVNVTNHDVSLINDLDDEIEPEEEDFGEAGIKLDYDDGDVLVIEDVMNITDTDNIDIDINMSNESSVFGSFGTMLFNIVSPSEPTNQPRDMTNRVEVISEKTVNNSYITGDEDIKPSRLVDEVKPSKQSKSIKSTSMKGGNANDSKYDPDSADIHDAPNMEQLNPIPIPPESTNDDLDDSIIDNGSASESDSNDDYIQPIDQPDEQTVRQPIKPTTDTGSEQPITTPVTTNEVKSDESSVITNVEPVSTPVSTLVESSETIPVITGGEQPNINTITVDAVEPVIGNTEPIATDESKNEELSVITDATPNEPTTVTDSEHPVTTDEVKSDIDNAFKSLTGGETVDPTVDGFDDNGGDDAEDGGEEDNGEYGEEEDGYEDGGEEEDQK